MNLRELTIEKVVGNLITIPNEYLMHVARVEFELDSFQKNFSHEPREGLKELQENAELWADPTPQIGITFTDASKEQHGAISDRLHAKGYVHSDDEGVTDEMLDREDVLVIEDYVCVKNPETGLYERMEDPERTKKAIKMIFEFMNKLGFEKPENLEVALARAKKEKYTIVANVVKSTYKGKSHLEIDSYRKAKLEDMESTEEVDAITEEDFK